MLRREARDRAPPPLSVRRPRQVQRQLTHTGRNVETRLFLDRQRLQGHGAARSTDENVGAETHSDARLRRRSEVASGKHSLIPVGIGKRRPNNFAAGSETEIKSYFGQS